MRPLSTKIAAIAPSATIEITDQARKMQAAGIDVISLSIGEPDFQTPAHITEACINALREGIIPPTINLFNLDPEIDPKIDFTFNKAKKRDIKVALSNNFGFGGHNATIIFKKM